MALGTERGAPVRLTVTLEGQHEFALPFAHNHLLQAAIYHLIEQPALSSFLHEQGFALGHRRFKLFTFSRLLGRARADRDRRLMVFSPPLKLVICSPVPYLLQELGTGLLRQGVLRLGEVRLGVQSVAVTDPVVPGSVIQVRMLSPVVVYSTLAQNGAKYTYYYSPFEPRFAELLAANLAKKFLVVHGRPAPVEGLAVKAVLVREGDFKVLKYKDTVIKGWMGSYYLQGDPELLKLALTAGLGAKNSQGFGCCVLEGEEV